MEHLGAGPDLTRRAQCHYLLEHRRGHL